MESYINDEPRGIHIGHRARMRKKLADFSANIFDTYELVEMLLYFAIPMRDTNPIAKLLLRRGGSLSGALSLTRQELIAIPGMGEHAAELIMATNALHSALDDSQNIFAPTKDELALHAISLFSGGCEKQIYMLSLDNSGRVIYSDLLFSTDFSSGGVRPAPFIECALSRGAASVIIAHNHPYGSTMPYIGDMESHKLISGALSDIGIPVVEHYIISGEQARGIISGDTVINTTEADKSSATKDSMLENALFRVLSFISDEPQAFAHRMLCSGISSLIAMPYHLLSTSYSESAAVLIQLIRALKSRRVTDSFKIGRSYSKNKLALLCQGLCYGLSEENVFLLCLDKADKLLSIQHIGQGVVNGSELLPRRIIECAIKVNASSLILVHNHPHGTAHPSVDDIKATNAISEILARSGIHLAAHYIVGESDTYRLLPQEDK